MDIILENKQFILTVGEDAISKSLVIKATGEECLILGEKVALFSVTEKRPYNNEIKLAYPNKRMTFEANRLRREGNKLVAGFELVGFEAVVEIQETDSYIGFTLTDFIVPYEAFEGLAMDTPPVDEFRMIQLPIKERDNFGAWLNVMWDEENAVNVLATHPFTRIDAKKAHGGRIMSADSLDEVQLTDCGAALIATKKDSLMDCIEAVETDYKLPSGVKNRRNKDALNRSMLSTVHTNPSTVDEHIAYAKRAGVKMMKLYYSCFFEYGWGYDRCGGYEYLDTCPNGIEDVKYVVNRIREAGIVPGLHFLQTHMGVKTRYVTPVVDHRLHLKRHFTLAKPLSKDDTTIYVEENPRGSVKHEKCRVLRFGGEAIYYEGFTTERPYCFIGCRRGHYDTYVTEHPLGEIGGILDVSEYLATSLYIDQRTSIQDEIAEHLAEAYNTGFGFVYYDGSEGVNAPYEIYIPYSQYRVYNKFEKEPLFCEGAAKSHFSWHMMSGGNAFDSFAMNEFKEKIAEFPLREAAEMAKDFTRVNFGWWRFAEDTRADIYEYGTSKAASWDCPISFGYRKESENHPRIDDILEVIKRWEDVREKHILTDEDKLMLRDPKREFTMLINENGEYELTEYFQIEMADDAVTAFAFERNGRSYVVCWHNRGKGTLTLNLGCDAVYEKELGGERIAFEKNADTIVIPVEGKAYFSANVTREEITEAFKHATLM